MDTEVSLRRLTVREQLVLSTLWFSLNVVSAALLPIVIPTQILLFVAPGQVGDVQQATLLGWLSTLSAVFSLFVPFVIGILSDHTTGPFGRRRPYIVLGTVCILLCLPLVVEGESIAIFIVGLSILQIGLNMVTAGYQSLTPDLVPKEQRGAASGYMGLMTILGNVVSLGLAAWLLSQINQQSVASATIRRGTLLYYLIVALILVIGVLITVVGIHESPFVPQKQHHDTSTRSQRQLRKRFRTWFVQNWIVPWRAFNFSVVFLTRFSVMMGIALFMTFIEYYFAQVAHVTDFVQATATVAVLALVGAVVSAFVLGMLSDHVKRAPLVSASTVCMGVAALMFVFLPPHFPLWPLGLLFGLGYGAYTSVDWALSVDALPSLDTVGKDLGIWSASMTLPAIAAPLLGSIIIAVMHVYGANALAYRVIFATATFFLVLAAIFILFVRERPDATLPSPKEQEGIVATPITPSASLVSPLVSSTTPERHVATGWKLAFRTHSGKPQGFLLFWPLWERFLHTVWHIQSIPDAPYHLMEVRFIRYHGRSIELSNGVHIQKGDPVIELHFRNQAFLEIGEDGDTWKYMVIIGQNLQALARWMQSSDFPSEVKAIYGVTLLSRGAPRLGFTLRLRPKTLLTWFDRFFMTGLLVLYNPKGERRLLQGTTYGTFPQEAWMSREKLLQRYGK